MEGLSNFMPFILMFVIVYFFMIAPQMKRAKKKNNLQLHSKKAIVSLQNLECMVKLQSSTTKMPLVSLKL